MKTDVNQINGDGTGSPSLRFANDPLAFISLCWPTMQIYDKQAEVLRSIQENIETFVHAANKTGKTRIAAIAIIWFFFSRTPSRVVVSSSSESQLGSVLWREIQHLIDTSAHALPFRLTHLRIEKVKSVGSQEVEALDYVIGCVPSAAESFQGHHLQNDRPRTLLVLDEASGVADELYDAGCSWAHCKLVIGNPLSADNFFYRLCKGGDVPDPAGEARLLRKVIHISGADSPNVRLGIQWRALGKTGHPEILIPGLLTHPEYQRHEAEWSEEQRTTRLYGHFYEGPSSKLVPPLWLDRAMDKKLWARLQETDRQAEAMGVDVACGGADKTVWTIIDRQGVISQYIMDISNTMEIVGRTIRLIDRYDIAPESVILDAGGGGKSVADRLREQGYDVQDISFGSGAEAPEAYKNRRAEMYHKVRDILDPEGPGGQFALRPDAHELRQELTIIPLKFDSEGKVQLPQKDEFRRILRRSPDRADSLALAVWGLDHPGESRFCENMVISTPEDDYPPTKEEIATYEPYFREICEMCDEDEKDYYDNW